MNNINIEAYLKINDLLGTIGPVNIDGYSLDAVVDLVILQTGSNELIIEEFEVDGGVVDAFEDDSSVVYLNYETQLGSEVSKTMIKFTNEVERLAIEYAKGTEESQWSYRIGEDGYA